MNQSLQPVPARETLTGILHWCKGPCGRELPVTAFKRDGRGRYWWTCIVCLRFRRRRRYRSYVGLRRSLRSQHHAWYVRNAEREREKERARYAVKRLEILRKKREQYRPRKAA